MRPIKGVRLRGALGRECRGVLRVGLIRRRRFDIWLSKEWKR